jgi:type IV secretory pathway TraG/TraD family ATPase VirD4
VNPRGITDQIADLVVPLLVAAVGMSGALRSAAWLTAALTGEPAPTAGLLDGAAALLADPANPGTAWGTPIGPATYWVLTGLIISVAILIGVALWQLLRVRDPRRARDPHRLVGLPTSSQVARTSGERVLVRRATTLRPSLAGQHNVRPEQVGYRLGRVGRRPVWVSVEDSITVLGPPRSGKGINIVIPMIVEAPGAVVTTSMFTDNIALTMAERARRGPVAVFAPSLGDALPSGMRWSPIRGCEEPDTAQLRATALGAGTGRGVENASFWQDKTIQALYPMLHAAAITAASTTDFDRWCSGPALAAEAVNILRDNPRAVPGWADKLDEIITADPRTRDNMWAGVAQATRALSNPTVLAACSPAPIELFDIDRFLAASGALYIVGDKKGFDGSIVAALIEDLFATAMKIANRSPGHRLDPPLLLALDEVANIAYLPSLPTMVSAGGGRGVTTVNVLQSRAQARDRWGADAERAIWGASTVKIVLGGVSDARDLQDLSTLVGTRDERTNTLSYAPDGSRTASRSWREVPIMRPEQIASMPKGIGGVALMVHPGQQPALIDLIPYLDRSYADQLANDLRVMTARLQDHVRGGPYSARTEAG